MSLLKNLFSSFHRSIHATYNYMLKLSSSPRAMMFLFIVAFAESSFFPIPPDIMIIPMILATPDKAWRIAGLATIASVIGGCFGYGIGIFLFDQIAKPLLAFYGYLHQFDIFKEYYHQWGAWIVFGAGITPFPYKVITIASGVVGLNLITFTVASIIARGTRFYLIAWLLKKWGEPMKEFIEKNLGILSVLFLILLIGGFLLIKYI
ncbi:MAG: DedA family protein [Alphaproteobacteria bacterium]|nr:DedA family protein [Alphaproteobacteria bacterium]